MKRRVFVLDEAEEELLEAEKWYEAQRSGLGLEFRQAIEEAMQHLVEAPLAKPLVEHVSPAVGARSARVKRFPFGIVFIEHEGDLWILAFAHHRRQPGYWHGRTAP